MSDAPPHATERSEAENRAPIASPGREDLRSTALQGRYVFGDHCSGRIWALDPDVPEATELLRLQGGLLTFGEDSAGELLVARGRELYRLVPAARAATARLTVVLACLAVSAAAGWGFRRLR